MRLAELPSCRRLSPTRHRSAYSICARRCFQDLASRPAFRLHGVTVAPITETRREMIMRYQAHLEQFQQTLQGRIDETTDPQMRSFIQETLESVQSQLDQLAAEEQQGYEEPKMREYRLLHQGELPRETKRSHIVFAEDEPREAERYRVVREGEHYRLVRDRQEEGE